MENSIIEEEEINLLTAIAALHLSCGRAENSLPFLKMAINLRPDLSRSYYLLANALLKLGRHDECYELLSRAPDSANTKPARAWFLEALSLLRLGRLNDSRNRLQTLWKHLTQKAEK